MHLVHFYIALSAIYARAIAVTGSKKNGERPEGLRERKRKQTRQRIAEAGLLLFGSNGYEATTLDAIAAKAGISRRTFFHYFKSKDEILLSLQTGLGTVLANAALSCSPDEKPFEAMREKMIDMARKYQTDELIGIDRIMRSSEAIQSRKRASYIEDEPVVFEALRSVWPEEDEAELRVLAMLSISITRLSLDAWSREGGKRPLVALVEHMFAALSSVSR